WFHTILSRGRSPAHTEAGLAFAFVAPLALGGLPERYCRIGCHRASVVGCLGAASVRPGEKEQAMLSKEENERLTRVGPGTPCGELLRRYWQPIAIASELTPERPKQRVTVLGEELVVFRDAQG